MVTTVEHAQLPVSQDTSSTRTGLVALQTQSPDDVVITLAIRSPLCKARKGGFKDTRYVNVVFRRFWITKCFLGLTSS
jgi:acetyl-CoA acyltransferase 1